MEKQVFNPYLPSFEYVPDGEPHVFGGRVYLYGSHDRFNGRTFCMNDYVCWSAPEDDLKSWRYEGVIWKRTDDPDGRGRPLYAPDVCHAPDGRYYLYYGHAPSLTRRSWTIRCAVSDSPTGPFVYHGEVDLYPYSKEFLPFDPAVYVENGRVWLYYGSAMYYPVLGVSKRKLLGGAVAELDSSDMLTLKAPPKQTLPIGGGEVGEHGFFEASSLRKIGEKYYFIYSSTLGHELCYAIGPTPEGPFRFGGTIVSIGDIGLEGHTGARSASNDTGNTHGSILEACGKYYVFYHRHTDRHCFSRQGCAEEIEIGEDGSIHQAEVTSCGLNGGPLRARGEYGAYIACSLTSRRGCRFYGGPFKARKGAHPYLTQSGGDREENGDQYIANFSDGATAGFKYFLFEGSCTVSVKVRGSAKGTVTVSDGEETVAAIAISPSAEEAVFSAPMSIKRGIHPLQFTFHGRGRCDLLSFSLSEPSP